MRSVQALLTACVLATSAMSARADWQYTRWGMTPAEVGTASNGAARDNPDRNLDAGGLKAAMTAPYQGVSLPFTAVFLFDREERLATVTLNPVGDISCPVIVQALGAHYGKPEGNIDMGQARTVRWHDPEGDNLVVYLDLGHGNCTIQYSKLPLTQPDGKSL